MGYQPLLSCAFAGCDGSLVAAESRWHEVCWEGGDEVGSWAGGRLRGARPSGGRVSAIHGQGRGRVLVVDDEPVNIHLLAQALEGQFDLFFATSGERALEVVSRQGVDLVLLDVVMPEMDGYQVCRLLKEREETKSVPVIFVTARSEVADEARGFAAGGVDYITKPFNPLTVAARVRTHVDLKRARDLLEELASVDGLTGVANRRQFDDTLDREWRRALRSGESLSLMLVDIDDFKLFNDTYGHTRGDDCLRGVTMALVGLARRPGDLVARFGGEEFALILPRTERAGLVARAADLLAGVARLKIPHESSKVAGLVTVSGGAASVVPRVDLSPTDFVERIDRLLYTAKSQGRYRCVLGTMDDDELLTVLPPEPGS